MKYIFTIFILAAFISGCNEENVKPGVDLTLDESEIPSQESWNSHIYITEAGTLKAVVYADHLRKFEDTKITFLEGVKIDFYNEDEKISSKLTSKKGRVDDVSRNMFAVDSVVAVSDSGVVLTTDELMWRNQDRRILTDKFVRITSDKEVIEGYGLDSDQHLRNYIIRDITYITNIQKD